MRHFGFRLVASAPGYPSDDRDQQDDHQRNEGGLGLACDAPGWFNLKDFLRAFSNYYWRCRGTRPLGTSTQIGIS
eukprot:1356130-Alexandrium_andersonii.AAC.1